MRNLICTFFLSVAASCAALITIQLDAPSLPAVPGETVTFSGTITNTSSRTVDLNSINVNAPLGFVTDIIPFFGGPASLAPNSTSASFAFFTVTVEDPFLFANGPYEGSFDILGGERIIEFVPNISAINLLGSGTFRVDVKSPAGEAIPEPGLAPAVFAIVMGGWGYRRWRERRS